MEAQFKTYLENNSTTQLVNELFTYLGENTSFFADEKNAKQVLWQAYKQGQQKSKSQDEDEWEIIGQAPQPKKLQKLNTEETKKVKYLPREVKPPRFLDIAIKALKQNIKCQCQATQTQGLPPAIIKAPKASASPDSSPDQSLIAPAISDKVIIPPQYLNPGRKQAIPLPYAHPPINNGGRTDKYVWTQTLEEIQISLQVPLSQRARELDVQLKPKSILVKMEKTGEILLKKAFYKDINSQESYWQLENKDIFGIKKKLILYLQKDVKLRWWKQAFKGDEQIDISKIVPTQNDFWIQQENSTELPHAFDKVIRERAYSESIMMNTLARKNMLDQIFSQKPDIFAAYNP